jgi:hypothetical protein
MFIKKSQPIPKNRPQIAGIKIAEKTPSIGKKPLQA